MVFVAMMLGSEMLLRVSEVLESEAAHYEFSTKAVELYLPHSKTDQLRRGVRIKSTHPMLCRMLRKLCAGVPPGQRIFTIQAAYLNELIRKGANVLGWEGYYSFHSFRHGTATDIWLETKDLHKVQLAGRWWTKAAARWYIHVIHVPQTVAEESED